MKPEATIASPVPQSTRVLIVDDSTVVQERLARLLDAAAGIQLVGRAADVAGALKLVEQTGPDAIILDLSLRGGSGLELLEQLRPLPRPPRVVVLTNYPLEEYRRRSLELGAAAFLDKSADFEQIVGALAPPAAHAATTAHVVATAPPVCLDKILGWGPAVLYVLRVERGALRAVWVTPNIERLTGFAAADTLHPEWHAARVHPGHRVQLDRAMAQLFEVGVVETRYQFQHRDGHWIWIHDELRLVRDGDGNPTEVIGALLNVSERMAAKRRAADRDAQYRVLAEATSDAIIITEGAVIRDINPGFSRALGYEEADVIGRSPLDFVAPEERPRVARYLAENVGAQYETVAVAKDGRRVEIEVTARVHIDPQGRMLRLTALRDLSERRRLERQFHQAQKMEAVARLSSVVAHDFNNVLTAAAGFLELALDQMAPDAAGREDVVTAQASLSEGRALAAQLLQACRPPRPESAASDVNAVLTEDEPMLRRLATPAVRLVSALAPEVPAARVAASQLRQVLMNLVINARDSMPEGGQLTIATDAVSYNGDAPPGLVPGRYTRLRVSDTGIGMDAAVQARIFEPFFTTKGGKGTGLGLASVYGIVSAAGGAVYVQSEPGRGTTFELLLPEAPPNDAPGTAEAAR